MASKASKDGKSNSTLKPIHPLAINDTSQSTEEWRDFVVQEIGKVSGEISSILKTTKAMPIAKLVRPREPTKPTPDLMELMIDDLQSQLTLQKRPSALDVWRNYGDLKTTWETDLASYLAEDKLVTVELPKANRSCFATLEPLISESLIDTIKKTSDGAAAYNNNDTLRMIALAMEFSEAQSTESSTSITATCKLKYETYKQPSGVSVSAYIGKKKRLLDEYVKARGAAVQDFEIPDIRTHLLRGVTDMEVNTRVAMRKSAGALSSILDPDLIASMLIDIEGDLNRERMTSILEGDIKSATAHTTTDDKKSSLVKKCDECGKKFTPKFPTHIRCDGCQKKVSAAGHGAGTASKAGGKAGAGDTKGAAKTPRREKSSKPKRRTLATDADSDESDGDLPDLAESDLSDSEDDSAAQSRQSKASTKKYARATFATPSVRSLASIQEPGDIIFDPASNSVTVKDASLGYDFSDRGPVTRITGSVPGGLAVQTHCKVGVLGRAPFSPEFSANIISEQAVLKAGYHVLHDTRHSPDYFCTMADAPDLVFRLNEHGTYTMAREDWPWDSKGEVIAFASEAVKDFHIIPASARRRAERYMIAHKTYLRHMHSDRVISALRGGLLPNADFTEADVRHAATIYGDCRECARSKGTKHRQVGSYPVSTKPGKRLSGDILYVMGMGMLVVTCAMVRLRTIRRLRSKSAPQMLVSLGESFGIFRGYGCRPTHLSFDQEPAVVALQHEIFKTHHVHLDLRPPEDHDKVAERSNRTILEPFNAALLALGHPISKEMAEGMLKDTVRALNFFPNSETISASPRSILDGERFNMSHEMRFYAGMVGEVEIPNKRTKGPSRKELVYVLCHQGDNAVVRVLGSGGVRMVIRSPHITEVAKSSAILQLIAELVSDEEIAEYDEYLSELREIAPALYRPPTAPPAAAGRQPPAMEQQPVGPIAETLQRAPSIPPGFEAQPSPGNPSAGGTPAPEPSIAAAMTPAEPAPVVQLPGPAAVRQPTVRFAEPEVEVQRPQDPVRAQPEQPQHGGRPRRQAAQHEPGFYADSRAGARSRLDEAERKTERKTYATDMARFDSLRQEATLEHRDEAEADCKSFHMMAGECAKRYGKDRQADAGIKEVMNIIGRGGVIPQDPTKLTDKQIKGALPSFMFYKAKEPLPATTGESESGTDAAEELPWSRVESKRKKRDKARATTSHGKRQQRQAERDAQAEIRSRWVGGGNHQHRGNSIEDHIAPTARGASHNILLAIAALEKRPLEVGDVPSAFLQAAHETESGEPVLIKADRETTKLIVIAYPDLACLVRPDGTMILRVALALYGLIESAWLWYRELVRVLEGLGYQILEADRGVAVKRSFRGATEIGSNYVTLHVDDLLCVPSNNAAGKALSSEFWGELERKYPGIKRQDGGKGKHVRHLGWDIWQDPSTGIISKSQAVKIQEMLDDIGVEDVQKLPSRLDLMSSRNRKSPLLDKKCHKWFRKTLQRVGYFRAGRADIEIVVSHLQRRQEHPTDEDLADLDHLLEYLNYRPHLPLVFNPVDTQLRMETDASYNITGMGDSQYGYIQTLGGATVEFKSGNIKTIVRSSTEAEASTVNEGLSVALWARDLLIELGYPQLSIPFFEDNQSCITMMEKEPRSFQTKSKHVRVKWRFYRQQHLNGLVHMVYCPTKEMRADLLTKPMGGNGHKRHTAAIHGGSFTGVPPSTH